MGISRPRRFTDSTMSSPFGTSISISLIEIFTISTFAAAAIRGLEFSEISGGFTLSSTKHVGRPTFGRCNRQKYDLVVVRLIIVVRNRPTTCGEFNDVRLALACGDGFDFGDGESFQTELSASTDRAGNLHWKGPAVVYHGDKRRFIYLNWFGESGGKTQSFRRIKLFLDLIPGLTYETAGDVIVEIPSRQPDGSPKCAATGPI